MFHSSPILSCWLPHLSPFQAVLVCNSSRLSFSDHSLIQVILFNSYIIHLFSRLQRRVVALNSEVDAGMQHWQDKKDAEVQAEEHRKSLILKPKGNHKLKKK